jgi:hypothetical protein
MQHHLAAADRIVVNDTRLSEAVGDKAKILALTIVALIKVDVKYLGVKTSCSCVGLSLSVSFMRTKSNQSRIPSGRK